MLNDDPGFARTAYHPEKEETKLKRGKNSFLPLLMHVIVFIAFALNTYKSLLCIIPVECYLLNEFLSAFSL